MPQCKKNFIITQDQSVRNILIASGFCLLSDICGTYTFANNDSIKFNFDNIDIKKLAFTNRLTF